MKKTSECKLIVILEFCSVFIFLTAFLGQSCTNLKVKFDFTDVLPSDSYVLSFVEANKKYSDAEPYRTRVFFRDVVFSDTATRRHMVNYLNELMELNYSKAEPKFWVKEFEVFIKEERPTPLRFEEQVELFLNQSLSKDLYSGQIIHSKQGTIVASTVVLDLHKLDLDDTRSQVKFLLSQRKVSSKQILNKDTKRWALFTFADSYYIWDFFAVATKELIMTTILGITSVVIFSLLFIPHPSGVLFIGGSVTMIYVDVLGVMYLCNLAINPVTYISIIVSIGLMVDYVFHVVLRYFESQELSRQRKVVDVLTTMGASVLIGGTSTVLGSVPLAFSQSEIFFSVFIVFFSFVVLSLAHGLLFVPVVLSIFGPNDGINDRVHLIANTRKDTGSTAEFDDMMDSS